MKRNEGSGKKAYGNDIGFRVSRLLGSAYGSATFLKVKSDMFHCGILNIDFIDKAETQEDQKSISTYPKVPEMNHFFSMVLDDELFKRLVVSCIDAIKAGKKYPDSLEPAFQGGTSGMCWILEVSAGNKMMNVVREAGEPYRLTGELLTRVKAKGNVMFKAKKGPGQTTTTGGVSMKAGGKQKIIQVPVGCDNLTTIAREVTSDWRIFKEVAYEKGYFDADGNNDYSSRYDGGSQSGGNYDDDAPVEQTPPPPAEQAPPPPPPPPAAQTAKDDDGPAGDSLEDARKQYQANANKNPAELINLFRGDYFFLSNLYGCKVEYAGRTFRSSEAAFQAAKCIRDEDKDTLTNVLKGVDARSYGRSVSPIMDNWDSERDEVMARVVYAKFSQNPELAEKLLATGSAVLVEGNFFHDNHWGRCGCDECQKLEYSTNALGRSLLFVRNCIKDNLDFEKYVKLFVKDLQKTPDDKGAA